MPERVAEPAVAWYRLTIGERAVLLIFCLSLAILCIILIAHGQGFSRAEVVSSQSVPARINPNTASMAELTALPGIGERKAESIVLARQQQRIETLEQLAQAAQGIPAAVLVRIQPFVEFDDEP